MSAPHGSSKRRRYTLIRSEEGENSLPSERRAREASPPYKHAVLESYRALAANCSAVNNNSNSGNAEASSSSHQITPSVKALNERYRRLVKIGEGSFGEVFIVYDTKSETYLTMKRMRRLLHTRGRSLIGLHNTAFRELHLLTTLSHPNIISVLDYQILEDGTLILFMPLMAFDFVSLMWSSQRSSMGPSAAGEKGGSNRGSSSSHSRMPIPVVKCLFKQLLEGVAFLHRHKVIHRDIKPSNIMVTAEGVVTLIDFGWARYHGQERMTPSPCTIGYRPPEVLVGGIGASRYDFAVDIWCCGCILFEMLSGGRAFVSGKSELDALASIVDWLGSPSTRSEMFQPARGTLPMLTGKTSTFTPRCDALGISREDSAFLHKLIQLEPSRRVPAKELVMDEWFTAAPAACTPPELTLPSHNVYRWLEHRRRKAQS